MNSKAQQQERVSTLEDVFDQVAEEPMLSRREFVYLKAPKRLTCEAERNMSLLSKAP